MASAGMNECGPRCRILRAGGSPNGRWSRGLLLVPTLLVLTLAGCAAGGRAGEHQLTRDERQLNVASFDLIWRTIRDEHFDPALGGLNWNAVRDELRPQVQRAHTMSAARHAMSSAIERLKQSHFAIIPVKAYAEMASRHGDGGEGETGLVVRVLDGRALVTAVRSGSPAEQAGVRPGWEIVRVADDDVAPALARIAESYRNSTVQPYMLAAMLTGWLAGPIGQPVAVAFRAAGDQQTVLDLMRAAPDGQLVRFGHLPPLHLRFETRRIEPDVGYIAFNLFFDPATLMPQFEQAVESYMGTTRGIIIDLRGNPGGLGVLSMGMAGWFVSHADQPLGVMHTRNAELKFAIFPRAQTYDGPLALLVDGCSASTAEIMAGGLQDLGRARIFGTRTAGAALPSQVVRLPNGDGFQYATADYVTTSGRRLEGVGVTPDVEVQPTRDQLLAGHDPVIDAAAEWIRAQSQ